MSSAAPPLHDENVSAFLSRLINSERKLDYLGALLLGVLPMLFALLIGAAFTIESNDATQHRGYLNFANWWSLAFLLPAALFAFRWLINKIAPVHSHWPPEREPPLLRLISHVPAQPIVYNNLRNAILARGNLTGILAIVTTVTILDMVPVVAPYFDPQALGREDWTSLFAHTDQISRGANATLVAIAYSAQFAITFIGVMAIVILLRHNLFFLANVYQRRREEHTPANQLFQIDVKDVNRCFGFRIANGAFNSQVIALMLGGLATLLSRYAHTFSQTNAGYSFKLTWPPEIPTFSFPLAGQWAMAVLWLCALLIVALPGLVKLLPRLPSKRSDSLDASIEIYLAEFFSDKHWPRDNAGNTESVSQVANRFANNAFWPSGDNRARSLFFFSYWIFFAILLPPALSDPITLIITLLLFAVLAYLSTLATFKAINLLLGYVDHLLITPLKQDYDTGKSPVKEPAVKLDVGVFISYRRKDTVEYARSIHAELQQHICEDRVFRDLSTIEPGENFVAAIEQSLARVDYIIVLIGADWVSLTDAEGRLRLHQPEDMVRLEVATALQSSKRVIPVLLEGALMPTAAELPADLHPICLLNALEISDSRWDYDVSRLVAAIKNHAA